MYPMTTCNRENTPEESELFNVRHGTRPTGPVFCPPPISPVLGELRGTSPKPQPPPSNQFIPVYPIFPPHFPDNTRLWDCTPRHPPSLGQLLTLVGSRPAGIPRPPWDPPAPCRRLRAAPTCGTGLRKRGEGGCGAPPAHTHTGQGLGPSGGDRRGERPWARGGRG